MNTNAIYNGTHGKLWLSTDSQEIEIGSMQTFTLHQTNQFEDVDEADCLHKKKRFVGYELTGTLTKFKVGHEFVEILEKYTTGETPEITLIGKAYNPSTGKSGTIKVSGVTFNEGDVMNLEQKTAVKEELPFSAETYKWINRA